MPSVFNLFQEAYKKIEWKTNLLSNQWPSLVTSRLSRQIEDNFYRYRFFRRFRFPLAKHFFYKKARKKHPEQFPPLLPWPNLQITTMSEFVPGNILSKTEILGFFSDISKTFSPDMGISSSPLLPIWKPINETLVTLIQALRQTSLQKEWFISLENVFADFKSCYDLLIYLEQLWQYSCQNHLTYLKSSHVFWWCEQSLALAENIFNLLQREGLLAISIDNQHTLYASFQTWFVSMQRLRLLLLIDMYTPIFSDEALRISEKNEEIIIDDLSPIPETWFSKILDTLFPPQPIPKITTVSHTQKLPPPEQKNIQDILTEISHRPSTDELDWESVIFDAKDFLRTRQLLQDFLSMMILDLAPRYNTHEQLIESKHLFDQFDVPPLMRRLEIHRFILKGKVKGLSPLEQQEKDELVIKSTHWLYDRLHDILESYSFSPAGVRGEIGRHFVQELQALCHASSEEYNEIRKYGTFSQFKFNIKRIFSSMTIQTRYLSYIQQIEQSLEKLKQLITTEEIRLLQSTHSTSS